MKIKFSHLFSISPGELWNLMYEPGFARAADAEAKVEKVTLEDRRREDGKRFERLRFRFQDPLPGFMAKAMGTRTLTYDQHQVVDDERLELEWKVVPPVLADKFSASGTYRLAPHPQGCAREVEGTIEVSVPLVGGRIEKGIARQLEDSYDQSAAYIRRYLDSSER